MALDGIRQLELPDHGLVSSYHVFQPPGLVWLTMPSVALGGGRPEVAIVTIALVNAALAALLVSTVARTWGFLYATALGAFLIVGPDAFASAWLWHPSLYTSALAVMLVAGIRLHLGSTWWALVLLAIPGLYALVHYSGLVLYAPAIALVLLSRQPLTRLLWPGLSGIALTLVAWVPFLGFEARREWIDLRALMGATDSSSGPFEAITDRILGLAFALTNLGTLHDGGGVLPYAIWILVVIAALLAVILRRWRDPGFALPASMLLTGLMAQIALDQGSRTDVLMMWLVPMYALAAWGIVQIAELVRLRPAGRPRFLSVGPAAVIAILAIGAIDLRYAVGAVPNHERLEKKWVLARSGAPVDTSAIDSRASVNRFYLPCDPPYDWGSEVWYLREVMDPGRGLQDAIAAGAFRWRLGPKCPLELNPAADGTRFA